MVAEARSATITDSITVSATPCGSDCGVNAITLDIVLQPSQHRRVQRACAFIEAYIDQDLTLQSIAAAAGMNPGSLQRVFRAALGTTIFEYVRGRKLDRAREALERDNISVGEAAYLVGYRTLGNFSTAFRRRFGITPRQIRTLY